jgi:SAM-dependent methyltransferase
MTRTSPFDDKTTEYEAWFDNNPWVYQAELQAVKTLLPTEGSGIEIGVGTGRFASRLGITIGLEPSKRMRSLARGRGIRILSGVAENLPVKNAAFDYALLVTTICFLSDPYRALQEIHRILKANGALIVAFVDRTSPVGRLYEAKKDNSVFYRDATFYSTADIVDMMELAGFTRFNFRQTLFHGLTETTADEPVLEGHGKGSFVVLRGEK